MSLRRRGSRRSSPFSSKMRRRRCTRSMGRGRIRTEPSGSVSKKTVSPAFSPESTTQCFGSDTTYVEPPVSWSFLPSIGSPSSLRRSNHYRVISLHHIDYIVCPLTTTDSLESVGKRHTPGGAGRNPEEQEDEKHRGERTDPPAAEEPARAVDRHRRHRRRRHHRRFRRHDELVRAWRPIADSTERGWFEFCLPADERVVNAVQSPDGRARRADQLSGHGERSGD